MEMWTVKRSPGFQVRRTAVQLHPGDLWGLVGFGVGTQAHSLHPAELGHPVKVALHDIEVDSQRRRGEITKIHLVLRAAAT
jgi:hypothetical protein